MEFIKGEPPTPRQGNAKVDWPSILATLQEHPGEWAYIGDFNPSVGTHIRMGRYVYIDPKKYEATTRSTGEKNLASLFMRYKGEG